MDIFAVRLNSDPRRGPSYSAYPTKQEYSSIHADAVGNGFHEAVNFLAEDGAIKGYLPPRHSRKLVGNSNFTLVTMTYATDGSNPNAVVGIQVGCRYLGEGDRHNPAGPKLTTHYTCDSSTSLLLKTPIIGAYEKLFGGTKNWVRHPTKEIERVRFFSFINELDIMYLSEPERTKIEKIRSICNNEKMVGFGGGADEIGALGPELAKLLEDFDDIKNSNFSKSEKETLIKARLGQGKFRKNVESQWEKSCSVTGCSTREVLRASHIMPWRECTTYKHRLDPENGFLLSAHLDALFDKGLISFSDNGTMIISSTVSEVDRKRLGLGGSLRKRLSAGQKKYLNFHRNLFRDKLV
jgi:HNH endonuclease